MLSSYMHSIETSSRMDTKPTGNGRAAGASHLPIVRMSNTYIEAGDWKPEEIISETKHGIYV